MKTESKQSVNNVYNESNIQFPRSWAPVLIKDGVLVSEDLLNDEGSERSLRDSRLYEDKEGLLKSSAISNGQQSNRWSRQWSRTIREQIHRPILQGIHIYLGFYFVLVTFPCVRRFGNKL